MSPDSTDLRIPPELQIYRTVEFMTHIHVLHPFRALTRAIVLSCTIVERASDRPKGEAHGCAESHHRINKVVVVNDTFAGHLQC